MVFLKEGSKKCPYCGQPLTEDDEHFYCSTENCCRIFNKFTVRERGEKKNEQ